MTKQNRRITNSIIGGIGVAAGLGAVVAGYAMFREPLNISLERRTIRIPNAQGKLPRHGLRILHLSDTHFQGLEWRERAKINKIRKMAASLEYDLLIHTGDFWHNEQGYENTLALINMLPAPRLGAYGVLGNHDYVCYSHGDVLTRNWARYQNEQHQTGQHQNEQNQKAEMEKSVANNGTHPSSRAHGASIRGAQSIEQDDLSVNEISNRYAQKKSQTVGGFAKEAMQFMQYIMNVPFEMEHECYNSTERLTAGLAQCNMQMLTNRSVHLYDHPDHPDGVDIYLAGIDDVFEGQPNIQNALADIPDDATKILLSHNPDILDDPASRQFDLILSGHTHGGQIVLPWLGAAHTQSFHLDRHEAAGYLKRDNTQIYISRGVGEGIPLRFGAKPQITLLTVKAG